MDMFINTTSGKITLSLDNATKVAYLKSYTRQDYNTLLDWSQHSSAVYFGGRYLFKVSIHPSIHPSSMKVCQRGSNFGNVFFFFT